MTHPRENTSCMSGASLLMLIMLALGVSAITVLGCGWSGTSHSVRFNDYQTEREMGRLPPLPNMAGGLNEKRANWDSDGEVADIDYNDYSSSEDHSKKLDDLLERAENAQNDSNLRLERELLTEYLQTSDSFKRRSSANDRLDALTALDQGSNPSAVKVYLDTRRLHDSDKPDETEINRLLETIQSDRNLKDNVSYLRAAEEYRQKNFEQAAASFKDLVARYGHSEKREAALFMTAVATMKTSVTYIPDSGNSDYDQPGAPTSADQAWHDAFAAFQKVIDEYPRGRFFNDARGWQAYLQLRRHDRAGAMVEYYRLLSDRDEETRSKAVVSLQMIRWFATEDEMAHVEKDLANKPDAALAYAYHNIYNYSIDPGPAYPPYKQHHEIKDSFGRIDFQADWRQREYEEHEWQKKRVDIGHKELLRTLEFSKRLIAKYPNLGVGGAFALRAAQASEELDDSSGAAQFAQRALRSQLNAEEREQALWTLGVAQHRLRQFAAAKQTLATLIKNYPKSSLIEAARRNLAMIAEDAGDIDGALEQYIALNYDIDVGYLIDYLMRPEQLASFIQKHPDSPKKNEFRYALGIRYLRLSQWENARQTFAQVKTDRVSDYNYYCSGCPCDPRTNQNCEDPKTRALTTDEAESQKKDISPALLMRDVETANDLEGLERNANQAVGDEAKAEALYQYASYLYEAKSLLFYNPLATPGYYNLGMLAGEGRYRAANESQILFGSQQEHERLARALMIYLQIATQYPNTKAAPDALYTAAVCHERLANYNPYWRGIYQNGMHAAERMVTYADVKATYPNYQLPRGTYGWQPLTRTVNNGPGWAAPPPPPPKPKRLTRTERVKLYAGLVRDHLTSFWHENGKRWLTEIVIVLGLIFSVRIARRNQRRLRARLARQRIQQAKQVITYPWFDWFWIDPVIPSRREQIRKLLNDKRQEIFDLARDRRSRPFLLRAIISHSALTVLAVSLLWTIWFG